MNEYMNGMKNHPGSDFHEMRYFNRKDRNEMNLTVLNTVKCHDFISKNIEATLKQVPI